MSYDWKQFLEFSQRLYADKALDVDGITKGRVVVSRSYYAAFHYADDFLVSKKMKTEQFGGEHDKVIRSLTSAKQGKLKQILHKIGLNLKRAREKRIMADYYSEFSMGDEDIKKHLKNVENIIQDIDNIK
mgnify:CR=1 FL=1